jgi:hypothetical protein
VATVYSTSQIKKIFSRLDNDGKLIVLLFKMRLENASLNELDYLRHPIKTIKNKIYKKIQLEIFTCCVLLI